MLDLVALREMLSYSSIIIHTSCNPDDCQPDTEVPEPEEERRSRNCAFFNISLCGRDALRTYSQLNALNTEEKCK